jgi:predicted dehydrogenase
MSGDSNRRQFLQAGAVAGVGFFVSGVPAQERRKGRKERAKVERLKIACIGVGGKGSSDTDHAAQVGDVVAICDIDDNTLNRKGEQLTKAKKFNDFRELLEKMEKEIDAVIVSTPDHTHAPAAAMAIRLRKHVYCQKPLTHTVHEARTLRELAREYKVCTQMGNQGTAGDQFRTSVERLQAGVIGPVREVHCWTNRPIWPQSPKVTRRYPPAELPKNVHWDLFLGPAAERPYAVYEEVDKDGKRTVKGAYHPFAWRGWWDFGTGALGDMACHTVNMPFMGLRLGQPTSIVAESEEPNDETYPGWAKVVFEFPARGDLPPCTLTWYEGKKGTGKEAPRVLPDIALLQGTAKGFSDSGSLIIGEKATIYSPDDYGATRRLIGPGAKDLQVYEPKLPRRRVDIDLEQKREWVEAIRAKKPEAALSNFDYAATLTEAILLGNVAIKARKKLTYDGRAGRFAEEDANKLLHYEYRAGWKL